MTTPTTPGYSATPGPATGDRAAGDRAASDRWLPDQAIADQLHSSDEHPDLLDLARHLDEGERRRLQAIEEVAQQRIRPKCIEPWNREELPRKLIAELGRLGLGEISVDGSSALFQGLAHAALARADLSLSTLIGIHNELLVGLIDSLGSPQQRGTWLPELRSLRTLGAFCLTEPDHGSDIARGLATTATLKAGRWHIRGQKRWIGMGAVADLALIWARDTSDDQIKGFLVPTDVPGYRAEGITQKTGLRIMQNAEIQLDLHVPESSQLAGATSFSAVHAALRDSRAWVGWQAVGAQQALFDIARSYAAGRDQFGRPIGSFQLVQSALAQVAGNMGVSTAFMGEVTRLQAEDRLTMLRASLAKSTLTRLARESAAVAREILGGNGILSSHEIAKVAADIEAVHAYEGSYGINLLIAGREITGISAFG